MISVSQLTTASLANLFDHTQLHADARRADFEKLCAESREYGFKMVAINPAPVALCKELLAGTPVHVGAAIGFPLGQNGVESKVFETQQAIRDGADEIDYVINIGAAKDGNFALIRDEMRRIVEVCADLGRVFERRKKPGSEIETFSTAAADRYEDVPIRTEDYGSVLVRFANGARGVYHTSEVSAGHGCYLQLEVNGSKASAMWNQETADRMWMGFRDRDNLSILRNPAALSPEAASYSHLAKGHPEGWNDAFRNGIESFYRYIRDGRRQGVDPCDFATLEDAAYTARLVEAIVRSSAERRWVTV